ncbi:MAG: C39 family peptidase [Nanoarchaeota archaeon]
MILDIPKIKQLPNHCIPASLSMVFHYLGYDYSQEEIACWFGYDIAAEGGVHTRQEIVRCARAFGFSAQPQERIGLEGIMTTIDAGIPVLTVLNDIRYRGASHAVVVKGYRTSPNQIIVNDPLYKRSRYSYGEFSNRWRIRRKDPMNQYGIVVHD